MHKQLELPFTPESSACMHLYYTRSCTRIDTRTHCRLHPHLICIDLSEVEITVGNRSISERYFKMTAHFSTCSVSLTDHVCIIAQLVYLIMELGQIFVRTNL